ncbi:MAG: gamma-glutamyltransferase [Oscillatoria sp. PMC 1068.18]|nr:gamma-glutamyltransferase [Oscillatoria sp. PMC 1076.18]MEC4988759.1 gamma-glutamyltransferase [Oscillatoria sp. PMC 1068.18]
MIYHKKICLKSTFFSVNFYQSKIKSFCLIFLALQIFSPTTLAAEKPIYNTQDVFHPVIAQNGIVATQEALATKAGLAVLKAGGNAVDAAVTVGFTLAVTLPRAGNIGGGGFMLIHLADSQETVAIDYREKAPLAATRNMFLDENGEADSQKSRFSHLAVGVPGTVAGLAFVLEKYGTISLAEALQPAIELAEKGIPITEDLRSSLIFAQPYLTTNEASREIFFPAGGEVDEVGDILIQTDLAKSLRLIANQGVEAFYQGEIAEAIVSEMSANGGIITKEDLASYQPIIRQPVRGNYRGYDIYSMPPPSSGGVHLIQMLNILEGFPIKLLGHNRGKTIHIMTETMKFAYADRFQYLGDPDFVDVPVRELISKSYADRLRSRLNLQQATPSSKILPAAINEKIESIDTTHFSVIDKYGNAVANTYTLNFSYGSGITVPGTGILLNNEMDDFTAKPGVQNTYGLVGGELNAIEPEKRMLSSMTPTIILERGQPFLVTGSPGGSQIITSTLQVIMNVIDHEMNIATATNSFRFHHQWLPDVLQVEKGLNGDTISLLEEFGHTIEVTPAMGSTQSVMSRQGRLFGASDPRRPNALTLGY